MKMSTNIPATLRRWIDKNPGKVREAASGGGYNTDSGFAYDFLLERGWCCDDIGLHTIIEPSATAMLAKLRSAEKCECHDCVTGENW